MFETNLKATRFIRKSDFVAAFSVILINVIVVIIGIGKWSDPINVALAFFTFFAMKLIFGMVSKREAGK